MELNIQSLYDALCAALTNYEESTESAPQFYDDIVSIVNDIAEILN